MKRRSLARSLWAVFATIAPLLFPAISGSQSRPAPPGVVTLPPDVNIVMVKNVDPPGIHPVCVSEKVLAQYLKRRIEPITPLINFQKRPTFEKCLVLLEVTINEKGEVYSIQLMQGNPILGDSAVSAVSKWRYRPYYENGKLVPIRGPISIQFRLF